MIIYAQSPNSQHSTATNSRSKITRIILYHNQFSSVKGILYPSNVIQLHGEETSASRKQHITVVMRYLVVGYATDRKTLSFSIQLLLFGVTASLR